MIPRPSNEMAQMAAGPLETSAADGILGPNPFVGLRPQDVIETVRTLARATLRQPTLVLEQQAQLLRELYLVLTGASSAKPAPGDRRFADPVWTENSIYSAWLKGYLVWRSGLNLFLDKLELDQMSKDRARFVVALITEALAPSNLLIGNPGALKKAVETKGSSILEGLSNALEDLLANNAMPAQVDKRAFELGRNVAVSAGAVVFSNEVLEL